MEKVEYKKIDKSMFEFVQDENTIHDKKLDTKPIGYFKDALIRFRKNKSSVVAFVIIVILLLFAIFGPMISRHTTTEIDGYYTLSLPKSSLFSWAGWDGCQKQSVSQDGYDKLDAIFEENIGDRANVNASPIKKEYESTTDPLGNVLHHLYVDSYYSVGFIYANLSPFDYLRLQAYQEATNIQVIYPLPENYYADTNANVWYKTTTYEKAQYYSFLGRNDQIYSTKAIRDENGDFIPVYLGTNKLYNADYVSTKRLPAELADDGTGTYNYKSFESIKYDDKTGVTTYKNLTDNTGYYSYAAMNQTGYKVRVNYYEYYKFNKTTSRYAGTMEEFTAEFNAVKAYKINSEDRVAGMTNIMNKFSFDNDGYYCTYLFGSNDKGKDIFVMLSSGARLSFILAISVSLINLTIGAIYGAIEGYFGGAADMIMERISDILSQVPFIVVATLFNLHLQQKVGPLVSLLFAFVLTGWIGMASRTRMQFYRFKGQEYVLSARTLGAKDARIMFKHIFPNALGTLITGSILSIPGVIFSESSLSYLHIIDLESSGFTSVGTLLSNGTSYVNTYPHVVFFPAIFISLLMISFNLLGNGLRDAFNPSLRGTDE